MYKINQLSLNVIKHALVVRFISPLVCRPPASPVPVWVIELDSMLTRVPPAVAICRLGLYYTIGLLEKKIMA